jgi:hypothetical protein
MLHGIKLLGVVENKAKGYMTTEVIVDNKARLGRSGFGTSLVLLGAVGAFLGSRLHVIVIHSKSLVDLAAESSVVINAFAILVNGFWKRQRELTERRAQSCPSQEAYQ